MFPVLPLLMATAALPPPECVSKEYTDYEITFVKEVKEENRYRYTYHIKNTGTGYIDSLNINGKCDDPIYADTYMYENYGYTMQYTNNEAIDSIFKYGVIAPNQEADIDFVLKGKYSADAKMTFNVAAFNSFDDGSLTVSGTKEINVNNQSDPRYGNQYWYGKIDLTFEGTDLEHYCYGAIIKTTYAEKEHYLMVDNYRSFYIQSNIEISNADLSNTEVVELLKIKYPYSKNGLTNVLVAVFIVIPISLFLLFIVLPVTLIIVLTVVRKKKNRQRNNKT